MIVFEISSNRLKSLSEIDKIFKRLKEAKGQVEVTKVTRDLESTLSEVFGCPFQVEVQYIGPYIDNCGILPILKSDSSFEKTSEFIRLINVRMIYIIIGMKLIKDFTPRQLTSILLHEIGHVVNHVDKTTSMLNQYMGPINDVLFFFSRLPIIGGVLTLLNIITSRTLFFTQHVGEYNADKLAIEYGYGDELLKVMHKWNLQEEKEKSSRTFIQKMESLGEIIFGSSHPSYKDRIDKIASEIANNYAGTYKSKRIKEILDSYYVKDIS